MKDEDGWGCEAGSENDRCPESACGVPFAMFLIGNMRRNHSEAGPAGVFLSTSTTVNCKAEKKMIRVVAK